MYLDWQYISAHHCVTLLHLPILNCQGSSTFQPLRSRRSRSVTPSLPSPTLRGSTPYHQRQRVGAVRPSRVLLSFRGSFGGCASDSLKISRIGSAVNPFQPVQGLAHTAPSSPRHPNLGMKRARAREYHRPGPPVNKLSKLK